MVRRALTVLLAFLFGLLVPTALPALPARAAEGGFVRRDLDRFVLDGQPFAFYGANNPTLQDKPDAVVDDVLDSAVAMRLKVLRLFPFVDAGSADGSVPTVHPDRGMFTTSWDPAAGRPVFNDGPDGLQRVDRLLAGAAGRGLKIEFVLTDNDPDSGGIEQYLAWFGLRTHDQFFTDAAPRQAYRDWVEHLLTRVNSVTGVAYRDDPTIFAWELADGPRCYGRTPASAGCGFDTITGWAREMSGFVRGLDANHLIGVGDEGFTRDGRSGLAHQPTAEGVDHLALMQLPAVDFATYQTLPSAFGEPDAAMAEGWIATQGSNAVEARKPSVEDDIAVLGPQARQDGFLTTMLVRGRQQFGPNGTFVHTLGGHLPGGEREPDADGMSVYHPSSTSSVITTFTTPADSPDTRAPLPVSGLGLTFVTTTGLTLFWRGGADDGGAVSYRVYRLEGDERTLLARSSVPSAALEDLQQGQAYTVAVETVDAAGNASPLSAPLSFRLPVSDDLIPGTAPSGFVATDLSPTAVTLSWSPGTHPVAVLRYSVRQVFADGTSREVADPAGTSVRLGYLRPGTPYTFSVGIVAPRAPDDDPVLVSVVTPGEHAAGDEAPTAPGRPRLDDVSWRDAHLSWPPSQDDAGVSGYRVERLTDDGWVGIASGPVATATLTGLRAATRYTVAVVAVDTAGQESARSEPLEFTTAGPPDFQPPTQPGRPEVSGVTPAAVSLTWPPSTDDVGVLDYLVVRLLDDGTELDGTGSSTPSATVDGLEPDTDYTFAVYARDTSGQLSERSEPVTARTATGPAGGSCAVRYTAYPWTGGFTALLVVTNTGDAAAEGWELTFGYRGTERLASGWSAQWSQETAGGVVSARNPAWNARLEPGASAWIGFTGVSDGEPAPPEWFSLNGRRCQLAG